MPMEMEMEAKRGREVRIFERLNRV